MRIFKEEEGQAIVLVALAMSIFLLAAVGLAVDGSHIYSQRQMAQTAADAAAQAGIMSIFDGTVTFNTSTGFTCTTTDARTPCAYASKNGFGGSGVDTVKIDYPGAAGAPGVSLTPDTFPATVLRATVTRQVNTTIMRLLGPTFTNVKATATAAIVSVVSPVPIIVTHPTLAGSLSLSGNPTITICGGPHRSIQVNSIADQGSTSSKTDAYTWNGNKAAIDLSHAGPPDTGNCQTGTGSEFGVWGGPSTTPPVSNYNPGSTGRYIPAASPIPDPLINVPVPPLPAAAPAAAALANGTSGCPAVPRKSCLLYSPGLYPTGISVAGNTAVFKPGIYYIQSNGMTCGALCDMYMATGYTDSSTGWTGNMLVYNTGPAKGGFNNAGAFNLGANGSISLVGSPTSSVYKGILFFQDRNSVALNGKNAHSLGGGGGMTLLGTLYFTNNLSTMVADSTHYQEVDLQGTPGSSTLIQGEIIVGALGLGGNAGITMNLSSLASYNVDQVALVN